VAQAIAERDNETGPNLQEFWKGCNTWNDMNNITGSRADIKEPTNK
jgi:hypothetical protein